ncbi:MAG: hypothetical protein U5K84_01305 [Alkalibacterium sp.]|nr:hypothetical protein [Alkalibacterium sp.]
MKNIMHVDAVPMEQAIKYVALKAAEMLEKPIEDLKIITCHLE